MGTIVFGILSLICLFIGFRQFKQKVFLFNNAFLYKTKDEKQNMNKRPHYRQPGWLYYRVILIVVMILIYVIGSSLSIESNKES